MANNPLEAPTHHGGAATPGTSGDAWAEGDILVTDPHAVLPCVCARCGTSEGVEHVKLKAQWVPMWARMTILLSPLVYLIVFFIVKKGCEVQVGLCESHRTQRKLGQIGGAVALIAGLFALLGGAFLAEMNEALILPAIGGGFVLLIVGLVMLVVMAVPLRVQKITADRAEFKGAHAGLLQAVGGGGL